MASFEYALRKECGYGGAQPYWDWLLDVDDMAASPIFDPDTGFGGNGAWVPGTHARPWRTVELPLPSNHDFPDRTGGGCIPDGPFEGLFTALGPRGSVAYNPRCVRRDFCPTTFARTAANVHAALRMPTYGEFAASSEPNAHASGHYGIGGLYGAMTDKWSSRKCFPLPPSALSNGCRPLLSNGCRPLLSNALLTTASRRSRLLAAPRQRRPAVVVVAVPESAWAADGHFGAAGVARLDEREGWQHHVGGREPAGCHWRGHVCGWHHGYPGRVSLL